MLELHQSVARRVMLKVFETGTTTAATGRTVAVVISKNGASFANPSAGATNATELASGWYYVDLSTTDINTLGDLVIRGTATGCDATERIFAVVDGVRRGMTSLPNAVAGANGGLPLGDSSARVMLQPIQTGVTIPTVTTITDGVVLAANQDIRNVLGTVAGSVGSVASGVTLATSQPNYAPSKAGDAMTLTSGERTAVANEVEAQIIDDTDSEKVLQAIVDKIAAANPSLEDLTLAAIASAVRTELSAELALIDAAITSRASQSSVNTIDDLIDTEIATIITNQGTMLGNQTTIINKTNLLTTFPTNFSVLSINSSGHIGRVALVDVTTTNTDMRGTNNAITATELNARTILAANYATASALAEVAEDTSLLIPELISEINPPTAAEIADKYLGRNIAGGSDGGRTVSSTYRVLRNKVEINESTNTITVYAEDDTTVAWTGSVTPAASTNHGYKAIDPG